MKDLDPTIQSFILHFGEMGSRWGINRTVGQIYALLYVSEAPMNAEQISDKLSLSRSNVSMSLKELQSWRLVTLQHLPGDRKDYFSTPEDILDIALTLLEERRKRELDPTLTLLRQSLLEEPKTDEQKHAHKRLQDMCGLMEQVSDWSDDLLRLSRSDLELLLRFGNKVPRLLEMKDKLSIMGKKKGG